MVRTCGVTDYDERNQDGWLGRLEARIKGRGGGGVCGSRYGNRGGGGGRMYIRAEHPSFRAPFVPQASRYGRCITMDSAEECASGFDKDGESWSWGGVVKGHG